MIKFVSHARIHFIHLEGVAKDVSSHVLHVFIIMLQTGKKLELSGMIAEINY